MLVACAAHASGIAFVCQRAYGCDVMRLDADSDVDVAVHAMRALAKVDVAAMRMWVCGRACDRARG
jgi:hypothetical protein